MSAETAAILNRAADVVDRNGLHKGDFYAEFIGRAAADCPVCMWGAINVAAFGHPVAKSTDDPMASFAARQAVRRQIGTSFLPSWNDDPDRTKAEVVAALRDAAQAEREAAS